MPTTGSYVLRSFSTAAEAELRRLQGQVDLFWKKERQYYLRCGLQDGMKVAECGSGPGYLTDRILAEFPACTCTAVEIDPEMVAAHRRRLAAAGGGRCSVIQGSILATGLPDSGFDFIIVRLVLEHLPDPLSAIAEIWRILKPGGHAVFLDNDFEFHLMTHPPLPELGLLYEAYCKSMYDRGGNPKIGRELPGLLQQAGFEDIDADILCAHSATLGDGPFLKAESVFISAQLVQDGYLAAETLDSIAAGWRSLLGREQHALFRQIFCAAGRKNGSKSPALDSKTRRRPHAAAAVTAGCLPHDRGASLETVLRQQTALLTGLAEATLDGQASLVDYGFDSLCAVELKNFIKSATGCEISIAELFAARTISGIAGRVALLAAAPAAGAGDNEISAGAPDAGGTAWQEGAL